MRPTPGDTIAAISTSLGKGAVALVRMSGDRAIEIADAAFEGARKLSDCPSHTVHYGRIVASDGSEVDEVLATVMRAPNTYTTEHMIEFGCHGGSMPARRVLSVCLAGGARVARPGEFTERAFVNGRMDLVQAEAVADVVAARTPRGLAVALGQLEGGLSGKLGALRETLLNLRSEVEAAIDFPDDVGSADALARARKLSVGAREEVDRLLASCTLGTALRDGVSVAIVGKPNVGKSSLMNGLLARDRSIVTAVPGTTRDAIEEELHIDGVPIRLIDTAGWRSTSDPAEEAGVDRARAAASGAALALLVLDVSRPLDDEDRAVADELNFARTAVALNKIDLETPDGDAVLRDLFSGREPDGAPRVVATSALTGAGLDELRAELAEACLGPTDGLDVDVSNVRHVDALQRVSAHLERLEALSDEERPAELMGSELADATSALGEITGETTSDDVIERIFERFCIGK